MTDKRVKIIKHKHISVKFEVDSRYSPLESIGTGAYGVVCAAKDNRTGQRVAIKKIPKVFEVLTIAKRTYRELKILRHLRHENIISILDVMQPPDDLSTFQDVYVVLDLMESDLHHIIHSVQPLSDEHIKFFLYQILRGLKYIHSASVLHRDLKPSNMLINQNCELKIGDFGMARGLSSSPEDHSTFMTEYVATRWYRAPELMLSLSEYSFSIDMWSVGCVFAEMLARRHLFPGQNYLNQLQLVLSVVGTPNEEYIKGVGSERVKTYLQTLPPRKPVDLAILFPEAGTVALDLLENLLQLDPKKRLSAEDSLAHKYLVRYHDPKDEPICTPQFDFEFEKNLNTKEELHQAIVEEIMDYHKCKVPIPSQESVKDALKKLMEDREKEREKAAKEGDSSVVNKDAKDNKEGLSKRKKVEDKKRPHHSHSHHLPTNKKRIKVSEEDDNPLTSSDKNLLERWKRIQQMTVPPIRKVMRPDGSESVYLQQQEIILKQQAEKIERQQKRIEDQQRVIHEQQEQIRVLQERHKHFIQECQAAGIKIPHQESLSANNVSRNRTNTVPINATQHHVGTHAPPPSLQPRLPQQSQAVVSLPPPLPPIMPHHSQVLSPLMSQVFPNVSPTNRTPPPPPTSQPHIPQPPTHLTPTPAPHMHLSSSSPSSISISISGSQNVSLASNMQQQVTAHTPSMYNLHQQSQMQMISGASRLHAHNPGPSHLDMISGTHHISSGPPYITNEGVRTSSGSMISDLTFSPLTSSELKELECPPNLVGSYLAPSYDPIPDDLESILNITGLPTGSGAGYGVGVMEEEVSKMPPQLDLSDLGTTNMGPPSASLLRDWLDVRQLDPDDMVAMEKELETGAPDVFMQAFSEL